MDDDVTMVDEWKFPTFLNEAFPPDAIGENVSEGSKAGFEKQGLSVTVSSPQEEGRSLPVTPQFGQKFNASSSLAERMAARAGFTVAKLSMPCQQPSTVVNPSSGALSPYLTIPPGLSPTTLLESPVFLSNAMSQASPTTGKLFSLTIDTDPNRMEGSPFEDGPDAFSFKPSLEFKSSQFPTEAKKDSLPTDQHSSLPSTGISVKTEAIIQTAQDTNVLNQRQFNGQAALKSSSDECKLNNRQAANTITGNHNSPPDQEDGDGKGDYSALATVTPAEDGYSWRKYGQKQVKHSEYPRSYYKCTHPNCQVKKKVERSHEGHITEIIYKGTHSHPKPAQSRRPGAPSVSPFGEAQMNASDNPASQANVEARSLWHNNGAGQEWRGDGVEVTSSPSVPGELCGSTAMQVQDGSLFESPEGVDDTSPLSDEVDGDDRVTHGSVAQGADGEIDELESKRRKLESCAIEMSAASRAVREPRVVIQTTSDVDILDDGYRWRKYGQKVVKGNPNPRSYYKCTHPGCSVRKHVERASHDLKFVITTYEGKHNHEVPAARNSGHPSSASGTATASPSQAHTAVRRPEPPAAQDGMVRLSSCAAPLSAFGLPPRDPLAPMSNFPYSLGQPGLPSLPMPVGLGAAAQGLKLPMFVPPMQPFLRHRPGIEAGFMIPKGEVKEEAAPEAGMLMPANGGGAAAAASVYQQMMSRLPLGPQM